MLRKYLDIAHPALQHEHPPGIAEFLTYQTGEHDYLKTSFETVQEVAHMKLLLQPSWQVHAGDPFGRACRNHSFGAKIESYLSNRQVLTCSTPRSRMGAIGESGE